MGEKRFKFQNENARFLSSDHSTTSISSGDHLASPFALPARSRVQSGSSSTETSDVAASASDNSSVWGLVLPEGITNITPINALARLINKFTANIDSRTNTNYQLPWNFGPFIEEIPRRLGHNAALDASAEALMAAYISFRARRGGHPGPDDKACMRTYGKAIKSLRECLSDDRATTSETLCSTMLLLMVEALSRPTGNKVLSHAGGAASILKARGRVSPRSDFEYLVLLSLRGPVLMHAIISKEPVFTDEEWQELTINPFDGGPSPAGRLMALLGSVPNLLLSARAAFAQDPIDQGKLCIIYPKLLELYTTNRSDTEELAARFEELDTREADIGQLPMDLLILHSHYACMVATSMGLQIMVCLLMSTLCAVPPPPVSCMDGQTFPNGPIPAPWSIPVDPIIFTTQATSTAIYLSRLSEKVDIHRPLGTMYMGWFMRLAYAAAPNEDAKARIHQQVMGFARDMAGGPVTLDLKGLEATRHRFTLEDLGGWRRTTAPL